LASVFAQPASARLLEQMSVSAGMAITMAETAIDTCKASGYRVSVTVIGRTGEVILRVRGDNASPHTSRKQLAQGLYRARSECRPGAGRRTSLTIRIAGRRLLTGVIAVCGAVAIKVGEETIGAIGVSGAPGGEKDEDCARAAIDKVGNQLK
jgi:uncharacterized protein GlcG (DUF336 family)